MVNASSSTRSAARSICASALITYSAMAASPVSSALGGVVDGVLHLAADGRQVAEHGVELLMECLAHDRQPRPMR